MTIDWFSFAAGFMSAYLIFKIVLLLDSSCQGCADNCNQGRNCPRRMYGED